MSKPTVYSLVYSSKATRPMLEADFENILSVARQRNPQHGITGILFYRSGHFFQVLEGEQAQVHSLLNAIKRDPRQTEMNILDECERERLFEDWSMDFQLIEPPNTIESVTLPSSPLPAEFNQSAIRLRKMLITFMGRLTSSANAGSADKATNPELVHSLVYTCMARQPMGKDEIENILEVSRRNNSARGITGILFFRDNQFLQVLEGEESALRRLMDTIRKDPRQTGLAILDEGKHPRIFGEWAMDFRLIDSATSSTVASSGLAQLPSGLDQTHMRLRKLLISFMNR